MSHAWAPGSTGQEWCGVDGTGEAPAGRRRPTAGSMVGEGRGPPAEPQLHQSDGLAVLHVRVDAR